jgi:TonB family C-terminal domain
MKNQSEINQTELLKYVLIVLFASVLVVSCNAQMLLKPDNVKEKTIGYVIVSANSAEHTVFKSGYGRKEYTEEEKMLSEYLSSKLKYPKGVKKDSIRGDINCSFMIDKRGKVSNVKIEKSAHLKLDKEVIRVIETIPRWTSITQEEDNVKVRYTLSISFVISMQKNGVYFVTDKAPEFPDGERALFKFLRENTMPFQLGVHGPTGRVTCSFIVDIDGSITNVEVLESACSLLDKEAVHIIKSMPKWIPGEYNGEKVKARYILPVVFKIN